MDVAKFIDEQNRMCESFEKCSDCPAEKIVCYGKKAIFSKEMVTIVEKWSSEHPQKTMLQDFLEKFPNAKLEEGSPPDCPYMYGYTSKNDDDNFCPGHICLECWNRPMEG